MKLTHFNTDTNFETVALLAVRFIYHASTRPWMRGTRPRAWVLVMEWLKAKRLP